MASEMDIQILLIQNNLTEQDMEKYYEKSTLFSPVMAELQQQGIKWNQLNLRTLNQLPDLVQGERLCYVDHGKGREWTIQRQHTLSQLDEISRCNYLSFERNMYDKINSHKKLRADEIESLIDEYAFDTKGYDFYKGQRNMESYIKLCDKYYSVTWIKDQYSNGWFDNSVITELKRTIEYQYIPEHTEKIVTYEEVDDDDKQ